MTTSDREKPATGSSDDPAPWLAESSTGQSWKSVIDFAPLLAFILAHLYGGLYWATGTLMAAMVLLLPVAYVVLGNISNTQLVTAVLVWVFGALTFWFHDTTFIKLKPTVFNLAFAAFLAGGAWLGKPVLKLLFGEIFRLTEEGWKILTWRWVGFFCSMALINEIVRMVASDTLWANFKVFGILGLTIAFSIAQLGLLKKYALPSK
ncbi:MAG TPA: septation protein IspZ [Hyphomicrobiaceae bacterium]|nr:septation protein IspZ [Hyphomicrobiaceae bacterium]